MAEPPGNIVDIYRQQGWNDLASIKADIAAGGWQSKVPQSQGSGATPTNSEQVTPYLNTYQQNLLNQSTDPALQNLANTFAPQLTSGGTAQGGYSYTVPEQYVGKSLLQLEGILGTGSLEPIARYFGISKQDPLEAGRVYTATLPEGLDPTGLGELNFLNENFNKATTTPTETTPTTAPQQINRVEEFNRLRTEMGVGDMESFLVDLKAQEEFLYAELRARTGRERGEPVPLGVISGRISEIERQQMERIDTIRRLIQTTTDQLNVAYSVITTFINYLGQDYQDAVNAYNDEFQRNITIYGLINDAKKTQLEEARFRTELEIQQIEYTQQVASANLQTMMNAIASGNVNYNDLPATTKAQISKLEAQAGLPVGFTNSLKMNPKDSVLFQTSNEGITQVGFIQPDGSVRVEKYGTRISSGGGSVTERQAAQKQGAYLDARNFLNEKGGDDKFVSPQEWNAVKSEWVQAGYGADEFDDAFRYTYVGDNYRTDIEFDEFNLKND